MPRQSKVSISCTYEEFLTMLREDNLSKLGYDIGQIVLEACGVLYTPKEPNTPESDCDQDIAGDFEDHHISFKVTSDSEAKDKLIADMIELYLVEVGAIYDRRFIRNFNMVPQEFHKAFLA